MVIGSGFYSEGSLIDIQAENTRLRAALAQSERPCVYCSLPAADWSKCVQGFPGCARADDAMGCPELGASFENEQFKSEILQIKAVLQILLKALQPFADYAPKTGEGAPSKFPGDFPITHGSPFAKRQLIMQNCYDASIAMRVVEAIMNPEPVELGDV